MYGGPGGQQLSRKAEELVVHNPDPQPVAGADAVGDLDVYDADEYLKHDAVGDLDEYDADEYLKHDAVGDLQDASPGPGVPITAMSVHELTTQEAACTCNQSRSLATGI